MINIKSNKMSYGIKFPTSIDELTPELLNTITEGVRLPKHYCIVALAFNTKLFDFCTAMNSNKETNVGVTPILAKIYEEDSKEINAVVGDKIIVYRTSLERGVHLNLKTSISSNSAKQYLNKDVDLVKAIITKNDSVVIDKNINKQLLAGQSPNIIVLEFKIIPVTDISAAIPMNYNPIDPFIYTEDCN